MNNGRCADCDCLKVGDVVEHKMNTNVFGIVLGFQGSLVQIRVAPSLATMQFHELELRLLDDDDEYDGPDEDEVPEPGNVVPFTLTARTKTMGSA
jgi:hypothetical protein